MTTIERSFGPDDVPERLDLYETYDWYVDRKAEDLTRALAATDELVGVRTTPDRDGSDGDPQQLCFMAYPRDE